MDYKDISIDDQLQQDLYIYGMSFEQRENGVRKRLDPTTIKMVKQKDNPDFLPEPEGSGVVSNGMAWGNHPGLCECKIKHVEEHPGLTESK